MFNTIVVGTDGSATADIAVARAAEIARLTGARLHVVSAYTPSAARVSEDTAGEYALAPDFKVDAVLTGTLDRLRVEGVEVKAHSPRGDPGDAIVEVAVQESADLIVLASRGMRAPGGSSAASRTRSRTTRPATC